MPRASKKQAALSSSPANCSVFFSYSENLDPWQSTTRFDYDERFLLIRAPLEYLAERATLGGGGGGNLPLPN